MKRRDFVKTAGLGLAGLITAAPLARAAGKKKRPNVILIMADDLGYECLGCNGGAPYQTPVLDGLAAGGVRFSNCVAQPLCTPSRAKIMTGKYNFRNYIKFGELDTDEKTFGHMMRDGGYKTCIAGKWQLGPDRKLVDHFGFDEYCLWWLENKSPRYDDPSELIQNGKVIEDFKGKYAPDIVSDFMLDFISRHKDESFFCYYPMILTHSPYVPTPDSKGEKTNQEYFVDMVEYTDKIVGKIVARLKRDGLLENTILLFVGDNGTGQGITSQLDGKDYPGRKGSMSSESGPHVPFVASWPSGGVRGKVYDDPIDFTDFLPTIADLTGTPLPSGVQLDGASFAPRLRGESYTPRGWAYISYYAKSRKARPQEMARDTRYTLRETGDLFDFIQDPLYQTPIPKGQGAPKAEAARTKLQAILNRMSAQRKKEDARLIALGKYHPPTNIPQTNTNKPTQNKKRKRKKKTTK